MRINVDRLCELAGVPGAKRSRYGRLMREGKEEGPLSREGDNREEGMDPDSMEALEEEADGDGHDEMSDPMDEIIDINEADLVKELRRARVLMREKKKIAARKQQRLQEMQLKGIIDQEVKNVLKELQLNSGWVYGNRKPNRSRNGYTHQGSFLKGLGFK